MFVHFLVDDWWALLFLVHQKKSRGSLNNIITGQCKPHNQDETPSFVIDLLDIDHISAFVDFLADDWWALLFLVHHARGH